MNYNIILWRNKIWRLDGKIDIESFYNIIFCMFDKNEKYIKELFSK